MEKDEEERRSLEFWDHLPRVAKESHGLDAYRILPYFFYLSTVQWLHGIDEYLPVIGRKKLAGFIGSCFMFGFKAGDATAIRTNQLGDVNQIEFNLILDH